MTSSLIPTRRGEPSDEEGPGEPASSREGLPALHTWTGPLLAACAASAASDLDYDESPAALDHAHGAWAFGFRLRRPSTTTTVADGADWTVPLTVRLAIERRDLERESSAIHLNGRHGLGAPVVRTLVALDVADAPSGRLWALIGEPMDGVALPELIGFNLHQAEDILKGFASHHAAIHELPVDRSDELAAIPEVVAADELARIDRTRFPAEHEWLTQRIPEPSDLVLCHGGYQPLCVSGPPPDAWAAHGGPGNGLTVGQLVRRGAGRARVRRGLHAGRVLVGPLLRQEPVRADRDQDDPQHAPQHLQARLPRPPRGRSRAGPVLAGVPRPPRPGPHGGCVRRRRHRRSSPRIVGRSPPTSRPSCSGTSRSSRGCDDDRRPRRRRRSGVRLPGRARRRHLLGQHRGRRRLDHRCARRPRRSLPASRTSPTPIPSRRLAVGSSRGEALSFEPGRFGIMPVAVAGRRTGPAAGAQDRGRRARRRRRPRASVAHDRIGVILGRGGYLTPGLVRLDQRVRTANQLLETLRHLLPDVDDDRLARGQGPFAEQLGELRPESAIGLVPNLAASRIANRLDLGGPAYTVDAACASSLIAVDAALAELASGRCDVVLAGGVHHCHDVTLWSVFSQLGALEHARARSARSAVDADGILIAEGTGVLVLERLADATRLGHRVYAVIAGTGVASDGRDASLMSPRVERPGAARSSGPTPRPAIDPATVGLVEGHGTATRAGDETELATLRHVYRGLGSGHEPSPGAGFGEVEHRPRHARGRGRRPHQGGPGRAPRRAAADAARRRSPSRSGRHRRSACSTGPSRGRTADGPRRAGVNAFGFGGINAHVIVEEHAGRDHGDPLTAQIGGGSRGRPAVLPRSTPSCCTVAIRAISQPCCSTIATPTIWATARLVSSRFDRPVRSSRRRRSGSPGHRRPEPEAPGAGRPGARERATLAGAQRRLVRAGGSGRGRRQGRVPLPGRRTVLRRRPRRCRRLVRAPGDAHPRRGATTLERQGREIFGAGRLLHAALGEPRHRTRRHRRPQPRRVDGRVHRRAHPRRRRPMRSSTISSPGASRRQASSSSPSAAAPRWPPSRHRRGGRRVRLPRQLPAPVGDLRTRGDDGRDRRRLRRPQGHRP